MAAWIVTAYVIANVVIGLYHTLNDYRKGMDFTLLNLIFLLTFGWWWTVPALLWSWLHHKHDAAIKILEAKVLIKAR